MTWARDDIDRLYRRTRAAVLTRCRALLGNPAEALDLTQEVYLALLESPEAFRGDASVVTYLYGIATKRALTRLRGRLRRSEEWSQAVATMFEASQPSTDPSRAVESRELLAQALAHADEVTALIVLYHFVDGLSQGEVAELVGLSRVTVNQRLQAFRKRATERSP